MMNTPLLPAQSPPAYQAIISTPAVVTTEEGQNLPTYGPSTNERENQRPESTRAAPDLLLLRANKYLDIAIYLNVGMVLFQALAQATGFHEKHRSLNYGLLGVDTAVSMGLVAYALYPLLTPPAPSPTPEQRVLDQA